MNEQIQELGQRMKFLEQQLEQLQHQANELEQVRDSVEEMAKAGEGQELLIPLGAGVFTKAKVSDNKKVLMNVGSKVVVEKDLASAKVLVEGQMAELDKIKEQMTQEMTNIGQQLQMMQLQAQ
tara:strand:+ start:313 stop:681 length:369 start_codon:yes stop_codon:yes gene_type:complete